MTATKRAAAYVRVSSDEQKEGWSLEGQEEKIRAYAEEHGYEIVQVYRDELSGSKDKRPGFERMMLDAHSGLFSAIIILHTSRLFRNIALSRRYKDELRNKLNIEVLFVNQPIDANDGTGFMVETLNEMFDEYYLVQLSMWTSLGKQTRAEKGLYNGTLPFGYMLDENDVPVPHPEDADGLRLAFEAYSTGRYSDREVAELLNREGYRTTGNWGERPFTKDTMNRILKNKFYLGYVKYKGELFPGQHPPLIDQELFDECMKVRRRRAGKKRAYGNKRRVYILAGIARCHECKLTLRCMSTGSKGGYRYYRHTAKERGYECSVPGKTVRSEILEEQWTDIISAIQLPEDWKQRIEELAGDADEREQILREREMVQEKLRRLKRMYQDLMIGDDEYRMSREKLQARLANLVLPSSPHLVEAGEYLDELGRLWGEATMKERRDLTRMMVKHVYVDVLGQRIVSIDPMPVFRKLFQTFCNELEVTVL